MTRMREIRRMETSKAFDGPIAVHESVFRSYHIVGHIERLLEMKVPHKAILDIIQDLRDGDYEDEDIVKAADCLVSAVADCPICRCERPCGLHY